METIKIIEVGKNGSAIYSIFNSNGQPVVTKKELDIIAKEIWRLYPGTSKKIVFSGKYLGGIGEVKEVDVSELQPTQREDLLNEIIRISSR